MTTQEFEKKIQDEVCSDLHIKVNPNHPEVAGVYLNDDYISVAVSAVEIKDEVDPDHVDSYGHPFRSLEQAMEQVEKKYARYSTEEAQALIKEMKDETTA